MFIFSVSLMPEQKVSSRVVDVVFRVFRYHSVTVSDDCWVSTGVETKM